MNILTVNQIILNLQDDKIQVGVCNLFLKLHTLYIFQNSIFEIVKK